MRAVPPLVLLLLSTIAAGCATKSKVARDDAALDVDDATTPATPPTIVYVVRHAEAEAPSGDPSLSEAGIARAQRLATLMADKQLAAIDTTQFKRTQETAKIVADAVGLVHEVQPVDVDNIAAYAPALAAHVKQQHAGKATLVVGHSNTVPATVEALSGTAVPPIAITEYERLYTITIAADGTAQLESGTY